MKTTLRPPKSAERMLAFLLTPDNSESILGDFAEMFNEHASQGNIRKACTWYVMQVLMSTPSLVNLKLSDLFERSFKTMTGNFGMHKKSSLWISLIALIPALILIIPGILQSGFGYLVLNERLDTLYADAPALKIVTAPVILLGGIFLAFVLNAIPAIRLRFERQPEGLTSVITFKPLLWHWIFIGLSILMAGILLTYGILENRIPITGT